MAGAAATQGTLCMLHPAMADRARSSRYLSTRQDRRNYAALARYLSLPPTSFMALHAGKVGAELFQRYGGSTAIWIQFRKEVNRDFPSLPVWTGSVAMDGQELASVPERIVYEVLSSLLPLEIKLDVHPRLPPSNRRRWADFRLTHGPSSRHRLIEVAGLVARDGVPRRPEEKKYRQQLVAKLEGYVAAGEPTPYLIFVDDICRDPAGLRAGLRQLIAELRGTAP